MRNINKILKISFVALLAVFISCEKAEYSFGDMKSPSDLDVQYVIKGVDENNPNGDGSGEVTFTLGASGAINYKLISEGKETMVPSGSAVINFSETGLHTYTVTVVAFGTGGLSSSKSIEVEVLVTYSPPADLLEMLTNGSSRTWRVKAEAGGHYGVGPADETSPIWWSAGPFDKDGLGSYDDRVTFDIDGSVDYVTNGQVFGKAAPLLEDFGVSWDENSDGEYENYPLDDFEDVWTLSAPGGNETLSFNDKGFATFYVGGNHSYTIIERSDNEMLLRTTGADGLGWFVILVAEN